MAKIEIEESKLTDLLDQLDAANAERKILKSSVIKIMDLLGLIDKETNGLKADIASGEESFVPSMLKALGDVVSMLTKSSLPSFMGGGDKAKQALADKFYFIQELLPIINKYSANENG